MYNNPLLTQAIEVNDTENYELSIQFALDGFSFSLHNPLENDTFIYREVVFNATQPYCQQLELAIQTYPQLAATYKKVYALAANNRFLLVPPCYTASEAEQSYSIAFGETVPAERVLTTHLPIAQINQLYGVEDALYQWVATRYPSAIWLHQLSPICEYFAFKSRQVQRTRLYALVHRTTLNIVCYNASGLLLANSYHCASSNDAAYYLLNTWQQMGLDAYNDEIHIGGDTEQRNELSLLLKTYIAQVLPVIFPSEIFRLGKETMHAPYSLITRPLCEL